MTYTDVTHFQYRFKNWTIATWPGTTAFNSILEEMSGDMNRHMDVESDICTVSDTTMEAKNCRDVCNALIAQNLKYIEKIGTPSSNENTTVMAPPSLFDQNNNHLREKLFKEKREEKPRAANYNLRTGKVKYYY